MNSPVFELKSITKEYPQEVNTLKILQGVSLAIKAGEMVALVGPSGSGKSTLLHIAGLLDTPTQGEVLMNGQPLQQMNDAMRTIIRRKSIGFVYQAHHLLPEFSALENVVLPQLIAGKHLREAQNYATELLSGFGLQDRLKHRPAKLSGGEQQRVAIARALANKPALLLADEPTGNLDPETAEQVFSDLMRMAKEHGLAALVATHNMELAARMDRTLHLKHGVIV